MNRRQFVKTGMGITVTSAAYEALGLIKNEQAYTSTSVTALSWVILPESFSTLGLHEMVPKPTRGELVPFVISGYEEPQFDTSPIDIAADRKRFLYLVLRLPSPTQISLFFQKDGNEPFSHQRMCRIAKPLYREGVHAFRLELSKIPDWNGKVSRLRLQFEGMMKGAILEFGGLAASSEPLDKIQTPSGRATYGVVPVDVNGAYKGERFVACCRTVLSIDELVPTVGLSTYLEQPVNAQTFMIPSRQAYDPQKMIALVKFVPSVDLGGRSIWVGQATSVNVCPKPGRLIADCVVKNVSLHIEALPLRSVCDSTEAVGACLFKIAASPPTPVRVDCGGMDVMTVWQRGSWLRDARADNPKNRVDTLGTVTIIQHPDIPRVVALKASEQMSSVKANGHSHARVQFANGNGWILATFARGEDSAKTLGETDWVASEKSTDDFYAKLLEINDISTPEPVMDEAFRAAILNLDYAWVKPYGCTESLHHWLALWQQYSTAVFDWIGLEDRSRECIESHAARQYKSGNIPYLLQYGERHEDFGGNNPTFVWQVRHYLMATNDATLASHLAPNLRQVVNAFYRQEDPNDNGIPGFGVQILTQEDYIATPHEGTSPAVFGIEMWRTLALVEHIIQNEDAAAKYELLAQTASAKLLSALWQRQLGRPAYFQDELGQLRPEGEYHTFVLPVVYRILDPLRAWTSIRHVRDRLAGPSGEIYCSNNFPNHMSGVRGSPFGPTWGMQAGAYMQAWGAWGLSRVGLRNEAYRPLLMAARWATMFPKLGAWEESSTELTPAYFANTAANYAQAVIEVLFGLELDVPSKTLRIQPAFPDNWHEATISLAQAKARYRHEDNTLTYNVSTIQPLKRRVSWALPACQIEFVRVNQQDVRFSIEPGVNCVWLNFETAALKETEIAIRYSAIDWAVEYPMSVAEGQSIEVSSTGCQFVAMADPCGIAAGVELAPRQTRICLATGLLDAWLRFGRLGQLNFSRRSVFLKCTAAGQSFWAAIDLALLPPYEAAPKPDLERRENHYDLVLSVRNNTDEALDGNGMIRWAGQSTSCNIRIPSRTEAVLRVPTLSAALRTLTPGDNIASLILPNGAKLDLRCPVAGPFLDDDDFRDQVSRAARIIELPADSLVEDSQWKEFAAFPVFWQGPYNTFPPPLDAVRNRALLNCELIPGIEFPLKYGRKLALASHRLGRASIRIDLDQRLRKIYLVVLPFVENHDAFTRCAIARVFCELKPDEPPFDATEEPTQWTKTRYQQVVFERHLTTPGDLDSFFSEHYAGPLATARLHRLERYALLPRLDKSMGDWPEGRPLASPYGLLALMGPPPRDSWPEGEFRSFPQPQYWASCPTIRTPSATFNVVELDLGKTLRVLRIELDSTLQDAAIGLVSAVGLVGSQ